SRFHRIDLAADDAPVAGLRCLQPAAEQNLAVLAQDDETRSNAGKVDSGPCSGHRRSGLAGVRNDQHEGRNIIAEADRRRAVVVIAVMADTPFATIVVRRSAAASVATA